MPLRKINGTNTEQMVNTALNNEENTSFVPITRATARGIPCRHRSNTLTKTKMA